MSGIYKKLDKRFQKDRNKKHLIYLSILVFFILLFVITVAYSTGKTTIAKGVITSVFSRATEKSERFYIFVKLESGVIIKIIVPRELMLKIGDSVNINKRHTNLFGLNKYYYHSINK